MIYCNVKIDESVASYLRDRTDELNSLESANEFLEKKCGIVSFFQNKIELDDFLEKLLSLESLVREPDRREFGDFQTNKSLANRVVKYVKAKKIIPDFILEPTCGRGNFILASLRNFPNVKKVVGIEIYKPYVWKTKFNILNYFLQNSNAKKPLIRIEHVDVFDYPFKELSKTTADFETLIIGNPP
jgi:tRNA/tmRNA/rRNA uracil-C5-methylase (TrmA/RlmC/RlmD family)